MSFCCYLNFYFSWINSISSATPTVARWIMRELSVADSINRRISHQEKWDFSSLHNKRQKRECTARINSQHEYSRSYYIFSWLNHPNHNESTLLRIGENESRELRKIPAKSFSSQWVDDNVTLKNPNFVIWYSSSYHCWSVFDLFEQIYWWITKLFDTGDVHLWTRDLTHNHHRNL